MKPSIFSKDYEKRMKRIKRRRIILAVCFILICMVLYFGSGSLKKMNFSKITSMFTFKSKKAAANKAVKPKENKGGKVVHQKVQNEEESQIDVTLSSEAVKAVVLKKGSESTFKYILPDNANASYAISASGKNMVILDKATQDLFLVTINGKVTNIGMASYKSEKTGEEFSKDQIIKNNQSYVWTGSPQFIDEDNVAFLSQVPWFDGRASRYVWIHNISSNTNKLIFDATGSDIKFDKVTDKGLTVIADGNTLYVKGDGSITK